MLPVKFEPGIKLPTVMEAKGLIDKADTVEKVNRVTNFYEAARAYAVSIGDLYKQADAAEVKQYGLRKIGLIYNKQKKPIGSNQYAESAPDSASTRQIIEGNLISARRLQNARVLGRMSNGEFQKHVDQTRDRIITKAAKKAAVETAKSFDQRSKVINMHLREFLTINEPVGRDILEIINAIDKFESQEDLDQIAIMLDNCKMLAVRAANVSLKIEEALEQKAKVIHG